jgi:1-acyl-sn-glycerol-3-phosphate acyltransferase
MAMNARRLYWTPVAILDTIVAGAAAITTASLAPKFTQEVIVQGWAKTVLDAGGIRVDVEGAENLPPGPVILMANHQSLLDVPALFHKLPYNIRFVAKKELFYIPVFGQALKRVGHIAVDRGQSAAARASLDSGADQIRAGVTVAVFPEGTRSKDGAVLPFKKGGFVLAIKSGVPIVPVSISGSRFVLPVGAMRVNPGVIRLKVHPVVATQGYRLENKEALMAHVREAIVSGVDAAFDGSVE